MKKFFIIYMILVILISAEGTPVKAQDKFGDERIPAFNTAARIVAVALAEVGYHEGEDNYSKYGKWNGLNYTAWCGSFVTWSAHMAGVPTTSIKRYANNCMAEVKWFKSVKRWKNSDYKPQPGDIIFIDSAYKYNHTGLVVKCEKDIVYTVEGNAKDMVKAKQYSVKDKVIIGYGIPKYKEAKTYAKDSLIGQQVVTLDSKSLTIKTEAKSVLTASVSPETTLMTRVWTSSNRKICTVNSKGEITGISPGVAIISVEITSGKVAKCKVTVKK
ncbi:MAG: CHAP domain-containing protein [Mobilitalea sp.]